jgi:TATA-binding protein-associated factor Taf7
VEDWEHVFAGTRSRPQQRRIIGHTNFEESDPDEEDEEDEDEEDEDEEEEAKAGEEKMPDVDSSGLSSPPTSDAEEPRPPVKKARRESDLSSGRVLRSRGKNKL